MSVSSGEGEAVSGVSGVSAVSGVYGVYGVTGMTWAITRFSLPRASALENAGGRSYSFLGGYTTSNGIIALSG